MVVENQNKVIITLEENGDDGERRNRIKNKTKMTFVDYIIKERSRKFLSISLMDMEKSNYKGTLEEWFSDMYTEYKILNQNKDE